MGPGSRSGGVGMGGCRPLGIDFYVCGMNIMTVTAHTIIGEGHGVTGNTFEVDGEWRRPVSGYGEVGVGDPAVFVPWGAVRGRCDEVGGGVDELVTGGTGGDLFGAVRVGASKELGRVVGLMTGSALDRVDIVHRTCEAAEVGHCHGLELPSAFVGMTGRAEGGEFGRV